MNLLFYLKKRPSYKNGSVTIYLRFTVNGRRAETSTGKSCDPNRWNTKAGRVSGTKEDARILNAFLDKLQSKALELHQLMTVGEETVTAETVKIVLPEKLCNHGLLLRFLKITT